MVPEQRDDPGAPGALPDTGVGRTGRRPVACDAGAPAICAVHTLGPGPARHHSANAERVRAEPGGTGVPPLAGADPASWSSALLLPMGPSVGGGRDHGERTNPDLTTCGIRRLHHGGHEIARPAETGADMPWIHAEAEPLPGFEEFGALFTEQEPAVDEEDGDRPEGQRERQICRAGVILKPARLDRPLEETLWAWSSSAITVTAPAQ
ncbi:MULTISPECIES: hypothetical protein [unclassified Streptomyces]|uniref:hypothetical protein n=1 Tax=unclassified Streptomyces TaxID=2593676 RepID=UPI0038068297